ncbi:hypothetical protein GCM10010168_68760 [Actinoplanes ianthinogenes]|uniref:Uncharacterized protein n=1 Tax=Actinoplanes ianthinogenes TaxID=122358 RepID=A0ABM7M0I4_9ACTN|nr:hypothetical protein [Actinoplanes ianthinogenes]BCJ45076.1 hypothetical protein Aiant_57330 [Actinoplanes ianthinogenes]GGR40414.1 hypothetical protein GCM10010168_68760 [Actinoplanes ianthinogenes]
MLDDATPPVIAANIFGRTMLALPALLLIAWTAMSQEEGESWVGGDGSGAMIFSLGLTVLALGALLAAPLHRFRRARPAVVLGWALGAVVTVSAVAALTCTG